MNRLKYINQAVGSSTCGQTTLAMLLSKTTEEVCEMMKMGGGTRTKDLIRVLDMAKVEVKNRRLKVVSMKTQVPAYAILHLRGVGKTKKYWGHWSLLKEGFVYDPGTIFTEEIPYLTYLARNKADGVKIASFIELV